MNERPKVPKFATEVEEAAWWYDNRELTANWMEAAIDEGRTTTLSAILERARQRSSTATPIMVPLNSGDVSVAQALAARKGVATETYLETLLHDALEREANAAAVAVGRDLPAPR